MSRARRVAEMDHCRHSPKLSCLAPTLVSGIALLWRRDICSIAGSSFTRLCSAAAQPAAVGRSRARRCGVRQPAHLAEPAHYARPSAADPPLLQSHRTVRFYARLNLIWRCP
jgi:hypothetical protein